MSLKQKPSPEITGQSIGSDSKSTKRHSGLFAFLKWFKPSTSRESIDADLQISQSSSCDSLNSTHSAGTVASFSYLPPTAYKKCVSEKCIVLGPETDTYKARLKQRDKRRENDRNLTLRKKYNLFFNRDSLSKAKPPEVEEENSKSLPLMTRAVMDSDKVHRRTNSESSKMKRAGAFSYVKGKRKAPQPPAQDGPSTASLRRKKRLAPTPPATEKIVKSLLLQVDESEPIVYADADIICNDTLKLDHGILKSAKDTDTLPSADQNSLHDANSPTSSARSSCVEAPVSPRPWYKRNASRDIVLNKKEKDDHKYEPIERLPEVPFSRNSTLDLTLEDTKLDKKKEEKRKSGLSFLTNISELDREASEIIKNKDQAKSGYGDIPEIPEFMRPRDTNVNTDSWVSPKRRSAKDLIAKFNAITNVTRVTVFGASQKDGKLFGKQTSLDETKRRQEYLLESHRKRLEEIDKKNVPLMKSESVSAIKAKQVTPKFERKSWKCPKCNLENEYWRIICHVCSAIKPYFDDFSSSSKSDTKPEVKTSSPMVQKKEKTPPNKSELNFERSKTQIGFSALANYKSNKQKTEKASSVDEKPTKERGCKNDEKEKLKKMLIEMKNSLPKRKSNIVLKQNNRASVIVENPEILEENKKEAKDTLNVEKLEKTQEEKVVEILIGTTQTIYENIKVKKTDNTKPLKVSSSAQTSAVVKQIVPPSTVTNLIEDQSRKNNNYELMRPKDFENIYSDSNATSAARIYANLARNDELSLFFNMPKNLNIAKNSKKPKGATNTDTIEINRLLKRLETSISKGELTEAAIFAKELAQMKINCSVIRQKPATSQDLGKKKGIQIQMYVEDKVSHRGPFPIEVTPEQTVVELKTQIENEFEIPAAYQRWILGKELVIDETSTLKDHDVATEGCPVFLYLVAPEPKVKDERPKTKQIEVTNKPSTSKVVIQPKIMNHPKILEEPPKEPVPENKIDKVKANVQNLQNILRDSRKETKKAETVVQPSDHIPKIIDLIPKVAENKPKSEIKIIPIRLEKFENKVDIKKANSIVEKPVSITKITIEQKPTNMKIDPGLEVKPKIQYVFPSIQNSTQNNTVADKSDSPPKESIYVTPKEKSPSQTEAATAKEEDFEDYDSKTLRPAKEWECHLCTLLNPLTSNMCAVCASVRLNKAKNQSTNKMTKRNVPGHNLGESSTTNDQTYLQLVHLDNADLVENSETFECVVCFLEIPPHEGITLRECLHQFCKVCLTHTIEFTDEAEVKCPYRDDNYSCNIAIQDREIKALVSPHIYEQHLAKSMAQAENKIGKSFHCKTPDCKGWCIFEDNVNEFRCPVCTNTNCLTCQAIHKGMNCKQYQEKMKEESEIDDDARRTKDMLEEMVNKGEAIECPTCKVILMKKWGCDWLRCSMCKTEICWVTRGPRWGPTGKGDTSGGCHCGENGVKCHPKCNYCH